MICELCASRHLTSDCLLGIVYIAQIGMHYYPIEESPEPSRGIIHTSPYKMFDPVTYEAERRRVKQARYRARRREILAS